MHVETGDFQGDHRAPDPRFANQAARECAPDFHLPALDLYLELTTASPALTSRKRRKVRLLRARHPEVRVRLFDRRDPAALARSHGLRLAA